MESNGNRSSNRWLRAVTPLLTHWSHNSLALSHYHKMLWIASKKTSKLCVTGLCAGNSPVTGEFPAQMASNAETFSIWWRHHVTSFYLLSLIHTDWKNPNLNTYQVRRHIISYPALIISIRFHVYLIQICILKIGLIAVESRYLPYSCSVLQSIAFYIFLLISIIPFLNMLIIRLF